MVITRALALLLFVLWSPQTPALVMNANPDQLPPHCPEILATKKITVHAGRKYAGDFPGKVFTYDRRVLSFRRCTKLTVTFVNDDDIRHQWMVHGLPPGLYDKGMFSIEVDGPGKETGTFILPFYRRTLLVHCGLPQHMQKGMKAMIKVSDSTVQPGNIPGLTGEWDSYAYPRWQSWWLDLSLLLLGLVAGVVAVFLLRWLHRAWQARATS